MQQHPFRLLATAITGRPVYIAYLKDASALAHADGDHVYVGVDTPMDRQRREILVQSLLMAGGSLQRSIIPGILGRPALRQRYLVLEVERCARVFSDSLPSSFLQSIDAFSTGLATASPAQSLALANSLSSIPAAPIWFGTIHPLKLLRNQTAELGRPLSDTALSELESKLREVERELQKDDEDSVKDNIWQWLSSPLGKNGIMAKVLNDLLDLSSSPDGNSGDGGAGVSTEKVSARLVRRLKDAANALRSTSDSSVASAFMVSEAGAHSYPEWDANRRQYKPNWVTVEEVEAYTEEPLLDASAMIANSNAKYQRALAGLCFSHERHRGQRFGDDIVLDRLIDLTTDLRSGCSGDDRVYQANLKTRRDLGIQILLDSSSSTLEFSASTKKVCDLQAEAAWQLCRAFALLGDRVAMHGFHSWGRALLRFQRLKSFDETIGATVEHRIKNLSIAGYTRCGAAIRHGADQVRRFSGMPCRLLLVISDGYPYDDQYEGEYAAEDTKKALEEVRNQGIACVCISVGSDVDNQRLKRIYGDVNYLAVDRVDKLATSLRPIVEAAISSTMRHD